MINLRNFLFILLISLFLACRSDLRESPFTLFESELHQTGMKLYIQEGKWAQLKAKREEALSIGHHFKSDADRVSAIVEINRQRFPIKTRLKGDELDHLQGEHWSFQLKSKKPIFGGHKKVGIQDPSTKNHLLEWLFMQIAKSEGILAVDYLFFPLSINEGDQVIYAMESVPDNALLERAGRPKGPLLRFDEKAYWRAFKVQQQGIDSIHMLGAKINCINKNWEKETAQNGELVRHAMERLDQYRKGQISPQECFDFEPMSKYVALSELFGTRHNLRWINLRLYYSPEKERFEPVAFDCFDGEHPRTEVIWYNKTLRFEYLLHPLLDDPEFKKQIEAHLKRYASPNFFRSQLHQFHQEISENLKLLRLNEPKFFFDQEVLLKRAEVIRAYLNK